MCYKLHVQYRNVRYHGNKGQSWVNLDDSIKLLTLPLNGTVIFPDKAVDSSVLRTVINATASTVRLQLVKLIRLPIAMNHHKIMIN